MHPGDRDSLGGVGRRHVDHLDISCSANFAHGILLILLIILLPTTTTTTTNNNNNDGEYPLGRSRKTAGC